MAIPYRAAMLALAKLSLKQDAGVEIQALLAEAHPQGEQLYWAAEHNTVFYGWGNAGRVETTALALDVLGSAKLAGNTSAELESALSRGTLFLLLCKDRYGVWYSTQATVNVLQSLLRQLQPDAGTAEKQSGPDASVDRWPARAGLERWTGSGAMDAAASGSDHAAGGGGSTGSS